MKMKTIPMLIAFGGITLGGLSGGYLSPKIADYKIESYKLGPVYFYTLSSKLERDVSSSSTVKLAVCLKEEISNCTPNYSGGTLKYITKCECSSGWDDRTCEVNLSTGIVSCSIPREWIKPSSLPFQLVARHIDDGRPSDEIKFNLSPILQSSEILVASTSSSSSGFDINRLRGGVLDGSTGKLTYTNPYIRQPSGGGAADDGDVVDDGGDDTTGDDEGTGEDDGTGDDNAGDDDTGDGTDVTETDPTESDEDAVVGDSVVDGESAVVAVGDGFSDPSEHFVAGSVGGSGCSLIALRVNDFSPDFLMAIAVIALIGLKGMYGTKRN